MLGHADADADAHAAFSMLSISAMVLPFTRCLFFAMLCCFALPLYISLFEAAADVYALE